jgi:hypothetical protein
MITDERSVMASTAFGIGKSMMDTYDSPRAAAVMSSTYGMMLGLMLGLEHPEVATNLMVEHQRVPSPHEVKDLALVKGMIEIVLQHVE